MTTILSTALLLAASVLQLPAVTLSLTSPTGCFPLGITATCLTDSNTAWLGDVVDVGGGTQISGLVAGDQTLQIGSVGFGTLNHPSPDGDYTVVLPVTIFWGSLPQMSLQVGFADHVAAGVHSLSTTSSTTASTASVPMFQLEDLETFGSVSVTVESGAVTSLLDGQATGSGVLYADVNLRESQVFVGTPEPDVWGMAGVGLLLLAVGRRKFRF